MMLGTTSVRFAAGDLFCGETISKECLPGSQAF
jgi:hypothetical protein